MKIYNVVLDTLEDVKGFTKQVKEVDCDVRLAGKDENGNSWDISAKSLLCSLILAESLQHTRAHSAREVDWDSLRCECEKDIYHLISKYVR